VFSKHIYLRLPCCRYCCGSCVVAFVSSTNKISAINIRLPMAAVDVSVSADVVVFVYVYFLPSSCLAATTVCPFYEYLFTYSQVLATSQLFQFLMKFIFIANTAISFRIVEEGGLSS